MSPSLVTFRQSMLQVILSAIGKLAFLAVSMVVFKALPVAEAGLFALMYAVSIILATISESGLRGLLIRELARTDVRGNETQEMVSGALTCRLLTLVPYVVLTFGFGLFLLPRGQTGILVVIMLACWLDSNANVFRGALRAFGNIVLDASLMAAFRSLLLAMVGGLYVTQKLNLTTLSYALLIATACDALVALSFIKRTTGQSLRLSIGMAKPIELLKRGMPFTILAILGMLYLRIGLIILGLPKTDVALQNAAGFSLSGKIPEGVTFLPLALVGAAIPYLSHRSSDRSAILPVFRNLELLLGGMGIFTATCLIAFPQVIIPIVSTQDYLAYKLAFQIYGCTIIFTFLQYVYSNLLICLDQEKRVAWRYGGILVLNVILNLAVDWKWGTVGAVCVLLFCEMCAVGVDLYYLSQSGLTLSGKICFKWFAILVFAAGTAAASMQIPGLVGLLTYMAISGVAGFYLFYHTRNDRLTSPPGFAAQ